MTLGDGTEIGHPQIIRDDDADRMVVHFERPTQDGFDSARCELPSYTWTTRETRLSDSDRRPFEEPLCSNAHLPYRYAATATGAARAQTMPELQSSPIGNSPAPGGKQRGKQR